jgi:hypothetical protein
MNMPGSLNSPVVNTPGSLDSPVVNTPGSLDSPVVDTPGSLNSPVINTPGSQLLDYLEQASEQVYKRTLWLQIDQGVMTPQCINHGGVLTPWYVLH